MPTRCIAVIFAVIVTAVAAVPGRAAEPVPAAVTVAGPAHAPVGFGVDDLARLPSTQISVSFLTERGTHPASFEGPLLWTVLEKAGMLDPAMHREQVSQSGVSAGRDRYGAVLALGEIAPEFAAKQAMLAARVCGEPLGAAQLRVV